ncbi:tight adherence protein B [Ardenticatena maritima]|uniref:Tight adherence protein B n=1 Tax=Ardenticatena maritima TaxID=872965 RepID=A0A0M9UD75_9CHLR|nr:type II secretion system F family protein [Ardenticatena maritima]KPL88244.1 hypothetical protein SE16_05195 [Ardenticatena maritima]GAP63718.1 tight adherence protein B [Ardenticatena maritima]
MTPLVAAGLVGLSILLLFIGLAQVLSAPAEIVDDRLQRYAHRESGQFEFLDIIDDESDSGGSFLDELAEEQARRSGLLVELARADLKLTPREWFTFNFLVVLLMGLVGWLLFRNIVLAVGSAIVGIFLPRIWLRMRQQRRLNKFNQMLPDAIGLLANSLRAGYSLLQSMEVLSREMPDPIGAEFRVVIREVGLGLTEEQALKNLLERVPSDDLDMMITAINVQKEVGGNLAEILDILAYTIRERVRIQGEIRVLTSQQRLAGWVLTFVPVALFLFMFMVNREYVSLLYTTTCGWIMLVTAIFLIIAGNFAIRKIIAIEV